MNKKPEVYRPANERIQDFNEVEKVLTQNELIAQLQRCHNCGIPFCHGYGCPLGNLIPEFNLAVANNDLRLAWNLLSESSFFPEFTSRVCPALCEGSCCCNIDGDAVTIRQCEKMIIETAFANNWVKPVVPNERNGKTVAIIGSGPSGLYAAENLNRKGYTVSVFEANHRPGGLLRYGIPDFKLEKHIIDRRIDLMERSGVSFICDTVVGKDISASYLKRHYDHLILAIGTAQARDLAVPGRDLQGIYFALDYLQGQNKVNCGELSKLPIDAHGKDVLIIGGGDTGSDCAGTAVRQGAKSVTQIEIMPQPPEQRSLSTPWPQWPYILRTSSSHKEGCQRLWSLSTLRFIEKNGAVGGVEVCPVNWSCSKEGKPLRFEQELHNSKIIKADIVLLALGFCGIKAAEILSQLNIDHNERKLLPYYNQLQVVAVGDCANGASLVVKAMADAQQKTNLY